MASKNDLPLVVKTGVAHALGSASVFAFQWDYLERYFHEYLKATLIGYAMASVFFVLALAFIGDRKKQIVWSALISYLSVSTSYSLLVFFVFKNKIPGGHSIENYALVIAACFVMPYAALSGWAISLIDGIAVYFLTRKKEEERENSV